MPAAANVEASPELRLTDLEGRVLALVVEHAPLKPYEVLKILELSPAAGVTASTGTVYPIVRRLRERGFVTATPVVDSRRAAETLEATELGRAAAVAWVSTTEAEDALPPDVLRTRVLCLGMLEKPERIRFLLQARRHLDAKLEEVERYAAAHPGPFADLAYDGARTTLKARRDWLEKVLLEVAQA